jgi:hypothetical protein
MKYINELLNINEDSYIGGGCINYNETVSVILDGRFNIEELERLIVFLKGLKQ